MVLYRSLILAFLFLSVKLTAQTAPPESAALCAFPPYVDSSGLFLNAGFQPGNSVIDFTLFDTAGVADNLYSHFGQGKPVVLISGSYTCPQFRNCLSNLIPNINQNYDTLIDILIIYTLEAHPELPWNSPYAYGPWVSSINVTAGISFPQQQNYGQRLYMADTTLNSIPTTHTLLLDDTCNTWLSTFGPGPNMCYVLSENGIVRGKYGLGWNSRIELLRTIDIELGLFPTALQQLNGQPPKLFNHPSQQARLETAYAHAYSMTITDITGRLVFTASEIDPAQPFWFSQLGLQSGSYVITLDNGRHTIHYLQP